MPKQQISLNSRWRLNHFEEGGGEKLGAHLAKYSDDEWLEAVVPGDVHLDLMRAGKIDDPFYGLNYLDCRWMEQREWWYRRTFSVPQDYKGRRVELRFGAVDTFATIWVNGRLAGTHSNMFVPFSIDVSPLLKYGRRNLVAIRLGSPIKAVEDKPYQDMMAVFETQERLYARKAQMSYGWDVAPRVVTAGIWRPAYLVVRGDVAIEDVAVRPEIQGQKKAVVRLEITLRKNRRGLDATDLRIAARNGEDVFERTVGVRLRKGVQTVVTSLQIRSPKLWWPWNVGTPELYALTVEALADGVVQETCKVSFGIRSVELRQDLQGDGCRGFVFRINGEDVYAKGTNWIPGDAIFARMDRKKYRALIDLALANNINMFRLWGGGIYEDPYFYRLCDERGIMVWQDFMFTCAQYPEDEGFLAEVRYEAEKVVTELRNHPSLVIWCGDNEVDATRRWSGKEHRQNEINRRVLPEVCAGLDPTRPYIVSSPCSPFGDPDPCSQREGDNHIWHHGVSYRDDVYSKDQSRFVSEIGHLSIPWPESVRKFIPPEHLWPPDNKAWDFHFGTVTGFDPKRRERVDEFIANFGLERPDNLEDYAFLSQLIQALAYKEWIEYHRRRKFDSGGILYWNLYDNWPQFSDAAVDYFRNPKIAYYYAGKALSNLLVSLEDIGDGRIGVWLINDELKDRTGRLLLRCQRFDGGVSWTRVLPVKLPANTSRMVWDMRLPGPLMERRGECFAQAELLLGGRRVSEDFHFPAEFKDIRWPETFLSPRIVRDARYGGRRRIDLAVSSSVYGRLVGVSTPGSESVLSDNYFDIPPAEERVISITADTEGPVTIVVRAANARETVELGA